MSLDSSDSKKHLIMGDLSNVVALTVLTRDTKE